MYGNIVAVFFLIHFVVFELVFFYQMVYIHYKCVLLECVKLAALKVEPILYVIHSSLRLISNVNTVLLIMYSVFVSLYYPDLSSLYNYI